MLHDKNFVSIDLPKPIYSYILLFLGFIICLFVLVYMDFAIWLKVTQLFLLLVYMAYECKRVEKKYFLKLLVKSNGEVFLVDKHGQMHAGSINKHSVNCARLVILNITLQTKKLETIILSPLNINTRDFNKLKFQIWGEFT